MANGMSLSLEPRDVLAELGPWLNRTSEDKLERAFWKQILELSGVGWYASRATKYAGPTETHPARTIGVIETGAVYGSGEEVALIQAWRDISDEHASTGIRVIGIDVPVSQVGRLGHIALSDHPREADFDIPINDMLTRTSDVTQGILGLVADGVNHSRIVGHAGMTQPEMHELEVWIMSVITDAGAIPNPDITPKYGPTITGQL